MIMWDVRKFPSGRAITARFHNLQGRFLRRNRAAAAFPGRGLRRKPVATGEIRNRFRRPRAAGQGRRIASLTAASKLAMDLVFQIPIMKSRTATFHIFLASFLAAAAARGAITIVISPDAGGTRFSVTQDAANDPFYLDLVTTGVITAIPLSGLSFVQNAAAAGFAENFGTPLAILTELNGAGSSQVSGLRFYYNIPEGRYFPALTLDAPIELPPNGTYRFSLAASGSSSVSLDFANFIPGTYVETRPEYGQVTTIVVPEPGAGVMLLLGSAIVLPFRRRRGPAGGGKPKPTRSRYLGIGFPRIR
jgi:hypothetical protein